MAASITGLGPQNPAPVQQAQAAAQQAQANAQQAQANAQAAQAQATQAQAQQAQIQRPIAGQHATATPQQQQQQSAPYAQPQAGAYTPPQGNQMNAPVQQLSIRSLGKQQQLIGRTPIAEILTQFRKGIEELLDIKAESDITLIELPGTSSLNISALIVAVRRKASTGGYVAYHTVLLASTLRQKKQVDYTIGSLTFTRVGLATEGYDENMKAAALEAVRKTFPGFSPLSAAASTLPESFDYKNEQLVQMAAENATTACTVRLLEEDASAPALCIGINYTGSLRSEIKTGFSPQVNQYGQPVRADVVLELFETSAQDKPQGQSSNNPNEFRINDGQSADMVSNITGFMDLTWEPSASGNMRGMMPPNMNPYAMGNVDLASFTPRFVITNLDTIIGNDLSSLLLSLATTQALPENDRWLTAMVKQHELGRKNHAKDAPDLRDLGALGYEVNSTDMMSSTPGARLDTTSASFQSEQLYFFLKAYVRKNKTLVSIDIDECGPNSWNLGIFAGAAAGNTELQNEIIAAAMLLTNGHFAKHWDQKLRPVYDDNCRVNLGWYLDGGIRRDIRDIDLVAMLNIYGATNISVARDWSNYYSNAEQDMHLRNALMRDKINEVVTEPHFEGYARRYTFHPMFLYALAAGVADAGLQYQTQFGESNPMGGMRAVLPFLANMQMPQGPSNAFTTNYQRNNMRVVGEKVVGQQFSGIGRW